MNSEKIIIGSRGSDLALWQARFVQSRIEELGHAVEIKIIKTQGDIIQHLSFEKMEGKGFFTKELEKELLEESIDLAVHSFKDLETNYPEGLTIGAVCARADHRDLLLIREEGLDASRKWELKRGALVGTSSARRKLQLRSHRPDISLDDIRGNVPTRVAKLRDGRFDAIVLAKAGLDRLEYDVSDLHVHILDPTEFIPAPAQGALAVQIRDKDARIAGVVAQLHREDIAESTSIERRVLNLFQGGCQLPLGAYCHKESDTFVLRVAMAPTWQDSLSQIVLRQKSPSGLAERAVETLQSQKV